jgi:hypothetical protein
MIKKIKTALERKNIWLCHKSYHFLKTLMYQHTLLWYSKIKIKQIINEQQFHLDSFYSLQTEVNKTLTTNKQHLKQKQTMTCILNIHW